MRILPFFIFLCLLFVLERSGDRLHAQDLYPQESAILAERSSTEQQPWTPLSGPRAALDDYFARKHRTPKHQRLFQGLGIDLSWMPGNGHSGLGMTRISLDATFGLPGPRLKSMNPSYFLLSPSFSYTSIDWKRGTPFPDNLYNAGLNVMWLQPINERWSFMAGVMPGWAGDGKASHDSVRCPAMFGFSWQPNRQWRVTFGAAYLDRSDTNFLPYGGLVWTPNDDFRVELTAPQARVAWASPSVTLIPPENRSWRYVGLGFGGGSWAVRSVNGRDDYAMYREFSLSLGTEWALRGEQVAVWEIAYVFGRRMEFDHHTQRTFKPNDSLHLRVKFQF